MEHVIFALFLPGAAGAAMLWVFLALGHMAAGFFRNAIVSEDAAE